MSERITFCINTARNEYDYISLLLGSLYNAIDVNIHDVMIFIDSDNQGTAEMLTNWKESFPNLTLIKNNGDPIGYASNINWMFSKAKTDIVSYLQSDMVPCIGYDKALLSDINDKCILSGTRVEPPLHSQSDNEITFVRNFGIVPSEFQYEKFLEFAEQAKMERKTNYFFAPFTCYKKVWLDIGGHDVSFIKSREDSDVAVRLALNGIELIQTWKAIVYHFTCTSSRGIEWWKPENQERDVVRRQNDQKELERFVNKWGRFVHPARQSDVFGLSKDNIVVKNPPIDESKFQVL